jgi:hypothetical protein
VGAGDDDDDDDDDDEDDEDGGDDVVGDAAPPTVQATRAEKKTATTTARVFMVTAPDAGMWRRARRRASTCAIWPARFAPVAPWYERGHELPHCPRHVA